MELRELNVVWHCKTISLPCLFMFRLNGLSVGGSGLIPAAEYISDGTEYLCFPVLIGCLHSNSCVSIEMLIWGTDGTKYCYSHVVTDMD